MDKKTYYDQVILRQYDYDKLVNLADAKRRQIEMRAEELAKKRLEELEPQIKVTIHNDRNDDSRSLYIIPSNQISEELQPAAQCVKYWVEEICLNQWVRIDNYKKANEALSSRNAKLLITIIGLVIGLVLAIVIR